MDKTIIIDNVADNFRIHKENGLHIKNFEGDENDNELFDIMEDLKVIAKIKLPDVREYLPIIAEKMYKRYTTEVKWLLIGKQILLN